MPCLYVYSSYSIPVVCQPVFSTVILARALFCPSLPISLFLNRSYYMLSASLPLPCGNTVLFFLFFRYFLFCACSPSPSSRWERNLCSPPSSIVVCLSISTGVSLLLPLSSLEEWLAAKKRRWGKEMQEKQREWKAISLCMCPISFLYPS